MLFFGAVQCFYPRFYFGVYAIAMAACIALQGVYGASLLSALTHFAIALAFFLCAPLMALSWCALLTAIVHSLAAERRFIRD